MKYMVLLGDGMADWPLPELDGRTPLEAARTPNMARVVERGVLGRFCPIPEGLPAGSDIGNLSLFGYDPRTCFTGRAPMEAANQGIPIADDEVAFRCNLVTLEGDTMKDFTSGHITSPEAAHIVATLNETIAKEFPVRFYPGVSYRHLAIVKAENEAQLADLAALACTPPHDITGQPFAPHFPKGSGEALIASMMHRSWEVLPDHRVNKERLATGNPAATSIWLWGQGKAPVMTPYAEKFGKSGAVVSAVDLVNGIGRMAGFEVLKVEGMTGWLDTNYAGKIGAALDALERVDFVYVHIEAPDETAHQGRADLKIQAIEDYDAKIVGPALAWAEAHPETRILIAPDHVTAIPTKTHAGGPVPFALCGPGIAPNGFHAYHEREAATSPVLVERGHELVERMLQQNVLNFA